MKQRAPALPDSATFQQLWDALGSKLIETAQGHLLYTQEVRGSSPLPPTINSETPHNPQNVTTDLLSWSYSHACSNTKLDHPFQEFLLDCRITGEKSGEACARDIDLNYLYTAACFSPCLVGIVGLCRKYEQCSAFGST